MTVLAVMCLVSVLAAPVLANGGDEDGSGGGGGDRVNNSSSAGGANLIYNPVWLTQIFKGKPKRDNCGRKCGGGGGKPKDQRKPKIRSEKEPRGNDKASGAESDN